MPKFKSLIKKKRSRYLIYFISAILLVSYLNSVSGEDGNLLVTSVGVIIITSLLVLVDYVLNRLIK